MKKVRDGYKITELGEIPSDWNIMKLSEVAEIVMGQSPDSSSYNDTEDGVAFFQGKTEFGRINPVVKKWCNNPTKISKPLDILISVRAPVGDVNINNIEACIGRGLGAIRATSSSNYKYLYYAIQKYNNQLKKASQGSTFEAINSNDLKGLKLPIPHIDEQEKIALILSTVDEQIDNVDALIEKNKELKKGLMQTLFTKGIGHTKFKNTEIGEIPEEWDVKKIGDICEVKGGKRLPKGYQLEDEDNAFPYIRVADMYMGGIRQDDIKYVPKDIVDKIKNYKISKDDLFISVAGTLGIVGQVPYELDGANLTENADKLCNIQINKLYLMKVLQSNIVQSIIEAEQTKSAQPKLALTRIKEFLIPVPSDIEQVKIASILMEVDEKIGQYKNKKQKLEELKKGLMQQLLTGMIRVTV
ncbi:MULTISPECIES: restriction endonuclease subunit S [Clostridia]|uniref:Restriction endonuclease subunit S n=2 Tax=Clostridia TaxID=186801 RepID=A0A8I0A5T3_9CLOT|nr:restriction endonuclease subunit S [Clostridium lentum]MBC5654239.1 restriction endonuclease subunit S [Blautia lenta]